VWLSFTLAAEQVERELGMTWGAAQKALLEACNSNAVKSQRANVGGPDIWQEDLLTWLNSKLNPPVGKQPRIIELLGKLYPEGVPAHRKRHAVKAELLKLDADLWPLDLKTLKTAIDRYNATRKR
jgi:hypothetical protein